MATAKCLVSADAFRQKHYLDRAGGTRAVFILGSIACLQARSEDVVSREPIVLNDEEKSVLSKGFSLPPHRWTDLDVILAKYQLGKNIFIGPQEIFTEENEISCKSVLTEVREFLKSSMDKDGAVIHYFGNGRVSTGDWCFSDGYITFQDLMDIYMDTYRGHVLTIVSDCSYSGHWVKQCYEFMDGQGIVPCGHHAIKKGVLLKVFATCRSTQTAGVLSYCLHGMTFDKNSRYIRHRVPHEIRESQHSTGRDFTEMYCGKGVDEECEEDDSNTWELKLQSQRVYLVRGKDKGRPAWHYVLVVDDEDTIDNFLKTVKSGKVNVANYGEILFSGFGEDPPNEVTEKVHRKYKRRD